MTQFLRDQASDSEDSRLNEEEKVLKKQKLIHKDLEDRNLLQAKSLKLEKIMNEKMSKRRIQIRDLQKQEIEEKQERRLLIRLHIFYPILLINLWTKNEK